MVRLCSVLLNSSIKMMRAVVVRDFGASDVCKVEDIPLPPPGPNQVLIKVKYAGVNPVDTYIRSGLYARKPELPYTPGSDCAGEIQSVGVGVTEFNYGDPVFTVRSVTGSCAEYCVAESQFVCPLNTDKLTYQQGACLGVPYFTAYRALITKGQAKAGQTVLIHGASGGVGTTCVQLAKQLGLEVYATAGTEEGMMLVQSCGADYIFNHRDPNYVELMKIQTEGKGFNLVVEMLANVNLQNDLDMLAMNGRVVIVGSRGKIEIDPRATMAKESSIIGCALFSSSEADWAEMKRAVNEHQQSDWLKPVVSDNSYTLETVSKAHDDIINSPGAYGNLVINAQSE